MPNLTELATVKEELSIHNTHSDDRLTRLINMTDDLVQKVLGRNLFYDAAIVEKVANSGRNLLLVSRLPLLSVASITYDGVTVTASDYSIYEANHGSIYNEYGWRDTGDYHTRFDPHSNDARQKLYTITYEAGYKMPGEVGRDLPYDLEQAAIDIVKAAYRRNGAADILKESVPDVYSVEYRNSFEMSLGIPDTAATILDRYNIQRGFA